MEDLTQNNTIAFQLVCIHGNREENTFIFFKMIFKRFGSIRLQLLKTGLRSFHKSTLAKLLSSVL